MKSRVPYAFIVVVALLLSGCRQPDGPIPTPDATVQEELVDVRRDLEYIASGRDPQAPKNLGEDLRRYADDEAAAVVDELSRRAASAVAGKQLSEEDAQRLAHNLWLTVAAREISERQVEALQNDTQSLLMAIGIAEENAQQVAAQVGEVQRAVTERPRRWYEFF